jgi:hypothetical protein
MAVEIYDDDHDILRQRDLTNDVFSFGLIVYEILCEQRVFPSSTSATMIIRRAVSTRASDRPMIPDNIHSIRRELMTRSWVPTARRRPSLQTLWKRMRGQRFNLFPSVKAVFVPRSA